MLVEAKLTNRPGSIGNQLEEADTTTRRKLGILMDISQIYNQSAKV